MPVQQDQGRVVLTHAKGATAEVLLYGATIVSWKTGDLIERLFVSSGSTLDGTRPVRGGIPIVFPCFGAPSHPEHMRLSQHGFARREVWAFERVMRDDDAVSVELALTPTASIRAGYDRAFRLGYVVTLGEDTLEAALHVTNTSTAPLEFQALLHSYIRAPADAVRVYGLQDKVYYDKIRGTTQRETRAGVDVQTATDAVYADACEYTVRWPGGQVAMVARGFRDVVVWNPQGAVSDMEAAGWTRYVCVEPGHVRGYASVAGGATWSGSVSLRV